MKKNKIITFLFLIISLCSCASNSNISEEITYNNKIDEKIFVPINGANQYLLIRGNNIENPVILYLHGGPGIPYSSLLYEMIDELKDDFTFVAWDQRGMGRTYYENKKDNPENNIITKDLAIEDVDYVVDYLRNRFQKEKIILIGHSYGSLLGVTYINNHPEKIEHYIGIAQSVNYREAINCSYRDARELLEDSPKKQEKLDNEYYEIVGTDDTKRSIKFHSSTNDFFEKNMNDFMEESKVSLVFHSPDFNFTDLKWFTGLLDVDRHIERTQELMTWLGDADLMKENKNFPMPVSFISGEYDQTCPIELIEKYIAEINAPSKNLIIIPYVGHSPQLSDPISVAKAIKSELLQ